MDEDGIVELGNYQKMRDWRREYKTYPETSD